MTPKWATQHNTALKEHGVYFSETGSEKTQAVSAHKGGHGGGVGWSRVLASHIRKSNLSLLKQHYKRLRIESSFVDDTHRLEVQSPKAKIYSIQTGC